jgi:WD40 repeat protein
MLDLVSPEALVSANSLQPGGWVVHGVSPKPSSAAAATVRLWHVASRRVTATLTGSGAICSMAFSPDGKTLAAGCSDNTTRLWTIP